MVGSAVLAALIAFAFTEFGPLVVHAGPGVLHSQMQSEVMPLYPAESVRVGHAGIAVADVHVSTSGSVIEVKVLQAPDAAIGSELTKAVLKWTFHPTVTMPDKTPVEVIGRVIFSFSLKDGKPQVVDMVAEHAHSQGAPR